MGKVMRILILLSLFLLWSQGYQAEELKSSVIEEKDLIKINLKNSTVIHIKKAENRVKGITQIYVKNIPLRPDDAVPIRPLLNVLQDKAIKRIIYKGMNYLGHLEQEDKVTIVLGLSNEDGSKDTLNWIFTPKMISINGRDYIGVQYNFEIVSSEKVIQVDDVSSWGIGGR